MTSDFENARKRLIIALDFPDAESAYNFACRVKSVAGVFKIGLQLFLKEGKSIVEKIEKLGVPIFLDLKLHDIPATVENAVKSVSSLNVSMLTVHTAGGFDMMQAAKEGSMAFSSPPTILGVTVLTSLDDNALLATGINNNVGLVVLKRAQLAYKSGIGGVVASPVELKILRPELPDAFDLVIPGIRPGNSNINDQKRVATPESAIVDGANFIVVGRPIRLSENPVLAAEKIISDIEKAISKKRD